MNVYPEPITNKNRHTTNIKIKKAKKQVFRLKKKNILANFVRQNLKSNYKQGLDKSRINQIIILAQKKKKQMIRVDGIEVSIRKLNKHDYISLTDMAGRRSGRPALIIANWLRNKDNIAFLGLWEKLFNPSFKVFEFEDFLNQAGYNSFGISTKLLWRKKRIKLLSLMVATSLSRI